MKKTLCVVMLIAGGYMSSASAVTISTVTDLGDLTGLAASVGNTFTSTDVGNSFSDVYTFDLSSLSQTVGTTVTIQLSFGTSTFDLSNMAIALTNSTGSTTYAMDNTLDASNALQLSTILNPGSDYRFVVTGDVTGSLGGGYGGVLQAAPVPEAETYAMMLAGLGLVGFMARRRTRMSA